MAPCAHLRDSPAAMHAPPHAAGSALATATLALVLTASCGGASSGAPASSPAQSHARQRTTPAPAAADRDKDRDSCLLYGTGYLVAASAPAGWRILCGDELPPGRSELAVVVPAGASRIAEPFMYFVAEALPAGKTLDQFVAAENQRVRASAPGAADAPTVTASGELQAGDGEQVPVWRYSQPSSGRCELTAFAPHGGVVLLVSVTARTPRALDALRGPFRQLVGATRFVTGNVQVDGQRGSAPARP